MEEEKEHRVGFYCWQQMGMGVVDVEPVTAKVLEVSDAMRFSKAQGYDSHVVQLSSKDEDRWHNQLLCDAVEHFKQIGYKVEWESSFNISLGKIHYARIYFKNDNISNGPQAK